MDYFNFLFLFANLINVLQGKLNLEILKDINGIEFPVSGSIKQQAGTNLTLICKLSSSDNSYDDEISWTKNFNNITEVESYVKINPKKLRQFVHKSTINKAIKQFHLVSPVEAGIYICMSLKYNLFKMVKLDVIGLIATYEPLRAAALHAFPNSPCTRDTTFICKSGSHCIDYTYVCDNVKDCDDGSDENKYLCGFDPCADKRLCSDGRCISESVCCDKHYDPICEVENRPSCCSEDDYSRIPSHSVDFDFPSSFNDKHDLFKDVHNVWHTGEKTSTFNIWIVVPCITILIIVVGCIAIRQYFIKKNSTRPNQNSNSHSNTPINRLHSGYPVIGVDKPPSYEEAIASTLPSAPPCEKIDV